MRAVILASLLGLCAVAHAGPPWTLMMDANQERAATVEQSSSGYPGIARVLVCIPKNQNGFAGKEITTGNLKVFEKDLLVFGARLEAVDSQKDVRMTFEIPERYLRTAVVKLQSSPHSAVTYLLRISDHLDANGRLPNRQTNQAEQDAP